MDKGKRLPGLGLTVHNEEGYPGLFRLETCSLCYALVLYQAYEEHMKAVHRGSTPPSKYYTGPIGGGGR